jgi:hypothetical protein
MINSIQQKPMTPPTFKDFEVDYKVNKFELTIIDDVRIYHRLFTKIINPSLKQPFLVSHVWMDKVVPIEQVVDYHQKYALDTYQDMRIKVGILISFLYSNEPNETFKRTIIYDTTNRMSYYHIPVLIQDNHTYLYDLKEYAVNKQLSMITEHLNKSLEEKKLEF